MRSNKCLTAVLGLSTALLLGILLKSTPAEAKRTLQSPPDPAALNPLVRSNTSDHSPTSRVETGSLYTVPAGKRLVIETISGRAAVASGTRIRAHFTTRSGGFSMTAQATFSLQSTEGTQHVYAFTLPVRLYADAGTSVDVTTTRSSTDSSGGKHFAFSGYLIPVP